MKFPLVHTICLLGLTSTSSYSKDEQDSPIIIKGSDTLGAKMVPHLVDAYTQIPGNEELKFNLAAEGSSTGFSHLITETCDIAMASRPVKPEEKKRLEKKHQSLHEHVVAFDMLAVIVHEKNPLRKLSRKQLEAIFTGDITDWSEVGGSAGRISVYTRNTSSGTYKSFQQLAMSRREYGSETQKLAGGEQIDREVAHNRSSIGYVGLAYAERDGIAKIAIDDVEPKIDNQRSYPLTRPLFFYVVDEPRPAVRDFIEWVKNSEDARKIISRVGFQPVQAKADSR